MITCRPCSISTPPPPVLQINHNTPLAPAPQIDPNMLNLFSELGIHDRLQWKVHQMIFAMQQVGGRAGKAPLPQATGGGG